MATEKRASSRSTLTNIGRVGAHACGDVELLAIATGVRLSQAALLLERAGGLTGVATAKLSPAYEPTPGTDESATKVST